MNYDTVTGLPSKESFLSIVSDYTDCDDCNRFIFLAICINAPTKKQTTVIEQEPYLLLSLVHRFIRTQRYILSAYRHDARTLICLLDSSLLDDTDLIFSLEHASAQFLAYVSASYPALALSLKGIIYPYQELDTIVSDTAYVLQSLALLCMQHNDENFVFFQRSLEDFHELAPRIVPVFEDIWHQNHIFIYLQPKTDLHTQKVTGAEALVRVLDINGKLLKPVSFLPVLEQYNLLASLDLMVTERILLLIRQWKKNGILPIPVSINISEQAFTTNEFFAIYAMLMEKYEDSFKYVALEIKHTVLLHASEQTTDLLQKLRFLGCHILVDDYSSDFNPNSPSYQQNLNLPYFHYIDSMICNRNMLLHAVHDTRKQFLLAQLVDFYENCNISFICKGIESDLEAQYAADCHIHIVQGFHYGRPLPVDIFQKKYMNYIFLPI